MEDFAFGSITLAMGIVFCFLGLRIFGITLPIFGFMAGFILGATGIEALFGDGFLSTISGWAAGIVLGLLLAALSYVFWYAGVLIAAAATGAQLGSGLMGVFGVEDGFFVFLVAAGLALLFAFVALALALPIWTVIFYMAMSGAVAIIAGFLLIVNTFDIEDLEKGSAWASVNASWLWVFVWAALAAVGMFVQARWITDLEFPDQRWSRMQYAT
ncbi:MAG TPA: DUF4203 domain-containing protein [Thermomicrobiales bacterium]|nr:DUF4203 domain-containing protein [Thermomicrobiales bacterium]